MSPARGSRWSRRRVLGLLAVAAPATLVACGESGTGGVARSGGTGGEPAPEQGTDRLSSATQVLAYGPAPTQYGHLDFPEGPAPAGGWPVVVLIHGGFWRAGHSLALMFDLARSLQQEGWATWNIQYSSSGDPGGGWPGTFEDVAAAVDLLAGLDEAPLDLGRVTTIGHSAGGHLALWAAQRSGLPVGAPGAAPAVAVTAAVSQAGVTDLLRCVDQRLGSDACRELMGAAPAKDLDRYRLASPIERLPTNVPTLLVHGADDRVVPVAQSTRYVERAREAGEDPDLVVIEGADHFDPIESDHAAWRAVLEWLPGR